MEKLVHRKVTIPQLTCNTESKIEKQGHKHLRAASSRLCPASQTRKLEHERSFNISSQAIPANQTEKHERSFNISSQAIPANQTEKHERSFNISSQAIPANQTEKHEHSFNISSQAIPANQTEKHERSLKLLPQFNLFNLTEKQEESLNVLNAADQQTKSTTALVCRDSVTHEVLNQSTMPLLFACLTGSMNVNTKLQSFQAPVFNNVYLRQGSQLMTESKASRDNSSPFCVSENTCAVRTSVPKLEQTSVPKHICGSSGQGISYKTVQSGGRMSVQGLSSCNTHPGTAIGTCDNGDRTVGQTGGTETSQQLLRNMQLVASGNRPSVHNQIEKLKHSDGEGLKDNAIRYLSEDEASQVLHDHVKPAARPKQKLKIHRRFLKSRIQAARRIFTKSRTKHHHQSLLYSCRSDHNYTNRTAVNIDKPDVNKRIQSEKCAADSTSRLDLQNTPVGALVPQSANPCTKGLNTIEFRPMSTLSTVAKPQISTGTGILSSVANPAIPTSFCALPKVAVPDITVTNCNLKSLASKNTFNESSFPSSRNRTCVNQTDQVALKDILNFSKPSIIPAFTSMIQMNPDIGHSMNLPLSSRKYFTMKRRKSDSDTDNNFTSELKRKKLDHRVRLEQKRPKSVSGEICTTSLSSKDNNQVTTTHDILKAKAMGLKHKAKLEMHEQYLKAKMDLMSALPDRYTTSSALPMYTALLPLPGFIDSLGHMFCQEKASGSAQKGDLVDKETPLSEEVGPTIEDFNKFRQSMVGSKVHQSTMCEPVDFPELIPGKGLFVPDSTVDGSISRKSSERTESENSFTATPLHEHGQMEVTCDHSDSVASCANMCTDDVVTIGVPNKMDQQLSPGNADFLALYTGSENVLDDLVNVLASDSLMTGIQADVQELAEDIQFNSQDFEDFVDYFSDDLMSADETCDDPVDNIKTETVKCLSLADPDKQGSSKMNKADSRRPEYRSARAPAKFSFWKHRKYEKRFPASYLKSKNKTENHMKILMETAEKFLGDDFNDKDKRSCRGKAIHPTADGGKCPKGKLVHKNEHFTEKSNSKQQPSACKAKGKKGKALTGKNEDEEVPEPRVTRQHTNMLKETMTKPRTKRQDKTLDSEMVVKTEHENKVDSIEHTVHSHDGKLETPKLPNLKLQTVKKVKNSMNKTWSIKNSRSPRSKDTLADKIPTSQIEDATYINNKSKKVSASPRETPPVTKNKKESSHAKKSDKKTSGKHSASSLSDLNKTPLSSKQKGNRMVGKQMNSSDDKKTSLSNNQKKLKNLGTDIALSNWKKTSLRSKQKRHDTLRKHIPSSNDKKSPSGTKQKEHGTLGKHFNSTNVKKTPVASKELGSLEKHSFPDLKKTPSSSTQHDHGTLGKHVGSPNIEKTPSGSKHMNSRTPQATSTPGTELSCKMCEYSCATREGMERHYGRQHPRWCYQCNKRFKSIEAFKLHLTKNHDTLIYCSICSTKFQAKHNYLRHLKTQVHINNVQHLKRVLGIKLNREPPSYTLVISSDDDDEDPTTETEVFVVDSNTESQKTDDETAVTVVDQEHESSTELDQETIKQDNSELGALLVRGKQTTESTKCKVCRHSYKKFISHCKSTKHMEKFKTSKFYKKYMNMRKPVLEGTASALVKAQGKVFEVFDDSSSGEPSQESSQAGEALEDSGVYTEIADDDWEQNKSEECAHVKKGNSTPDMTQGVEQLKVRYRTIYRSPILTSLMSTTTTSYLQSPSLIATPEQHHTHRYSSPKLEPHPTWDSTSSQDENPFATNRRAQGQYIQTPPVKTAPAATVTATSNEQRCSPTMLVKNISAELNEPKLEHDTNRMNIFDSFTDDHIQVLSTKCTFRKFGHNPLIDQIEKNKERIEMIKKERIERKISPMRSPLGNSTMPSPRQTHYGQFISPIGSPQQTLHARSHSPMGNPSQTHNGQSISPMVTRQQKLPTYSTSSLVTPYPTFYSQSGLRISESDNNDDIPACNQVYIVGDEPVHEDFCVIENVETMSTDSFQLMFDGNNNRKEQDL